MSYFRISLSDDGDVYMKRFAEKEGLLRDVEEYKRDHAECGKAPIFFDHLPQVNYEVGWLIIKGEIVVPRAESVVVEERMVVD